MFSESGVYSDYGPAYMMNEKIVLVVINYRLGPFGFLTLGSKEVIRSFSM